MSNNGYDRFIDFQFGYSGSFFKLLFQTMIQADSNNLAKLSLGFLEETAAVYLFKNDPKGKQIILEKCSPDNKLVKAIRENELIF